MRSTIIITLYIVLTGFIANAQKNYVYVFANARNEHEQFILDIENSMPQPKATGLPAKTISLSNGVKLEYVEQGDPNGTPVVFLHGITDSYHSYDLVLPHLPSSLHVFSITQRGHGNSDKPQSGYKLTDFATDIALFLDKVNIKKAVIVGHSMGGVITQQFAVQYPDYVLGVVLVSTFARFNDKPDMVEFQKVIHQLTDPIDPAFAKEFQQSTLKKEVPADFFETSVQESLKVPARIWISIMDELMLTDLTAALRNVEKPALIFWGDQDAYCPLTDQKKLLSAIDGSVQITYTGIGHALHWEAPERFATDLQNFIKGIK